MRVHCFRTAIIGASMVAAASCSSGGDPVHCGVGTIEVGGLCVPRPADGSAPDGSEDADSGRLPGTDGSVIDAPPGTDGSLPIPPLPPDCDEPVSDPALHVRTDGDDARCDGSANASASAAPACAYRTIQAAVDGMIAGDTVVVHEGVYADARNYTDTSDFASRTGGRPAFTAAVVVRGRSSASSAGRLTIRGAPGETAILDGGGTTNIAFWIHNPAVTIRNLHIRGFVGDPTQDIFLSITNFFSSPDGEFACNVVRNPDADAVEDGGGEVGFANSPRARIVSNDIESGMPQLVAMGGTSARIADSDSVIQNNRLVRVRSRAICPSCFRAERQLFIIGLKRSRRVLIDGNYIVDRGEEYTWFSTGLFLRDSEDYVVSNNVVEEISGEAAYLWHQDTWMGGANERARIVNNTFVRSASRSTLGMKLQCSGCTVANNLFVGLGRAMDLSGSGADMITGAPTRISHSVYDDVASDVDSMGSSEYDFDASDDVHGAAGFVAAGDRPDPYYRLNPSSAAVDRGEDATCGHAVSGPACDVGAYER